MVEVTFPNAEKLSTGFGSTSYVNLYEKYMHGRIFNLAFVDGGLIQMQFLFSNQVLVKHRLAFLPSPYESLYSQHPVDYIRDQPSNNSTGGVVVGVPLRFDFDVDAYHRSTNSLLHPKSHFTLGNFPFCRVPVSSPLSPSTFIGFVLRNFYTIDSRDFSSELPKMTGSFESCANDLDRQVPHIVIPA